jgi:uncharacterized membrane protein
VVVWGVATLEVWVVVDLVVVLEVEALEVVRKQGFCFLMMLVVHSSHTSVMKYLVFHPVILYVSSTVLESSSSLKALRKEVV